jgi:outer membrane immunogenic protein
MKKLVLAASFFVIGSASALAADLPARTYTKAPPIVQPVYNWTGCYIGIEGGGNWGHGRSVGDGLNNGVPTAAPAGTLKASTDVSGGVVGGTIGCNYQVNNWVVGIEGDGSWFGSTGTSATLAPFNSAFNESLSNNWLATVRGRAGFLARNDLLLFGTAGGAFTNLRINELDPATGNGAIESHQLAGWTAGVGAEWYFAPSWSAKFEYLYVDFGNKNYFAFTPTGCCTLQTTHLTDNLVRVGVNYHFNWAGPVVAKY